MTAHDEPRDPIADLRAACDRINAAHRPPSPTPLEFDVPALAGHVAHRAGPDVSLDDQAAFQSHAFAPPPRGWSSGWVAHPSTAETAPRSGQPMFQWTPPGMGAFTDLPVWASQDAPVGVLVPVYIRAAQEDWRWRVSDLVGFLRARLDEDEQRALGNADPYTDQWHTMLCGERQLYWTEDCHCGVPARVLAEVDAKRAIVERHAGTPYPGPDDEALDLPCSSHYGEWNPVAPDRCPELLALVQPYADHPDFDPAWRTEPTS